MTAMSNTPARRKTIPALLRSTLDRFYRSVTPGRTPHASSRRHRMHFESLDLFTSTGDLQQAALFSAAKGLATSATQNCEVEIARGVKDTVFHPKNDNLPQRDNVGVLTVPA